MSIFKFKFAHTIKQIWVIGEVMPEETSALGQLYDTLGVFGVVQGANEVMLRTLEREMGDTDQHIRGSCYPATCGSGCRVTMENINRSKSMVRGIPISSIRRKTCTTT